MRQPDQYPAYPDTVAGPSTVASLPALPSPRALVARRALLGAGMLGVAGDALLRNEPWGVGLLAWMAAFAVVAIVLTRRAARPLSREGRAWLAVALLFAAGLAWRDADLLLFFDVLAMLTALVLLAMSINVVPVPSLRVARVRDLLRAAAGTGLAVATGSIPLLLTDTEPHTTMSASAPGTARRFARAVLITLPIFLVFSILLAQADPLFGSFIRLPDLDLDVLFSHLLIAGFFAWIVAGWLRRTLLGSPAANAAAETPLPLALGTTDLALALGALNLLFAAFVAAQVGWLFGGEDLVLRTTGLSYAEYARRGFFELTWVAGLVLPVLLAAQALIPASDDRARRAFRRLSLSLLVLLGAIMLSAAARMRLYIHYYGISTDRLYASAFMLWLAMVFVWFAATVLRSRPRPFAAGLVGSGMGVLIALNILNPDALVARQNLARGDSVGSRGGGTDLEYVAALGGDAVPLVVAALTSPDAALAPEQERCAAARTLLERWSGDRLARVTSHWTQWNLGRQHAADAVAGHEPALRQLACPARQRPATRTAPD